MTCNEDGGSIWQQLPDSILLNVFTYLLPRELLDSALVCKMWCRVATDDYLWKDLLYSVWKIDRSIARAPGKHTWMAEFKRLYNHTPKVQSEVSIHTLLDILWSKSKLLFLQNLHFKSLSESFFDDGIIYTNTKVMIH